MSDVFVVSIRYAELHFSKIFEHLLGGGQVLVFDGRQPGRHVVITAGPDPDPGIEAEVARLIAAHSLRASEARKATVAGGSS